MSAPHIIAAIEDGPASQADTMVLIALADFADKEGRCWPSMATIAKKARMSERGARNCVQRLIADGWLVIERGGGRSCSNGYLVRISDKPNAARQPTQRTDARPNIPPTVRAEVFERDGRVCAYCGDTEGPFHIDHIVPLSRGGEHSADNLTVACAPCNLSKSNLLLDEWEGRQ